MSSHPKNTNAVADVWSCIQDDWQGVRDDDIIEQHAAIQTEEAAKSPLVGDKEPLSSLAAEYQSGSPIIKEKIKALSQTYVSLRRTRGDGNCFFRAFMFSYLEYLLETQDKDEACRISASVDHCKKTLQSLGYVDFTFEDFFALFMEQLESVIKGNETFINHEELLDMSRDPSTSNYIVMFFRFVTTGEIRRRSEFFEPFIMGLSNSTVDQFCKASVEPMDVESDHVQITALSDALGVPIRVVYLDRSSCNPDEVLANHHDFIPSLESFEDSNKEDAKSCSEHPIKPIVTLLYRPGHYDILYPK